MARRTDGASIVASFDPSALMRTAQALRIGAMENKAARWMMRGSFMVLVVHCFGMVIDNFGPIILCSAYNYRNASGRV